LVKRKRSSVNDGQSFFKRLKLSSSSEEALAEASKPCNQRSVSNGQTKSLRLSPSLEGLKLSNSSEEVQQETFESNNRSSSPEDAQPEASEPPQPVFPEPRNESGSPPFQRRQLARLLTDSDLGDDESNRGSPLTTGSTFSISGTPESPCSSTCSCFPDIDSGSEGDGGNVVQDDVELDLGDGDDPNMELDSGDEDQLGYDGSDELLEDAADQGLFPAAHNNFAALIPIFEMYHAQNIEEAGKRDRRSSSTVAIDGSNESGSEYPNGVAPHRSPRFHERRPSSDSSASIETDFNLDLEISSSDNAADVEQQDQEEQVQATRSPTAPHEQIMPSQQQTIIPGLSTIYPETRPKAELVAQAKNIADGTSQQQQEQGQGQSPEQTARRSDESSPSATPQAQRFNRDSSVPRCPGAFPSSSSSNSETELIRLLLDHLSRLDAEKPVNDVVEEAGRRTGPG
jgi:hypothetical protein